MDLLALSFTYDIYSFSVKRSSIAPHLPRYRGQQPQKNASCSSGKRSSCLTTALCSLSQLLRFCALSRAAAAAPLHCRDRRLRRRRHPVSVATAATAATAAAADKLTTSVQVVKEHKKVNVDNVSS